MDAPFKNKNKPKTNNRFHELVSWLIYSIIFSTLMIPFCSSYSQGICGGIILGFFAGLLNEINSNLKK